MCFNQLGLQQLWQVNNVLDYLHHSYCPDCAHQPSVHLAYWQYRSFMVNSETGKKLQVA